MLMCTLFCIFILYYFPEINSTKYLSNRVFRLEHRAQREHDYIAFAEYYNEPIRRSFGICDIYNMTITWLRKHDHMARYFPIFLVFGAKFQYFDNGE